jgi:uncharacterized protein YbaR (Trm112 family)
VKLEPFLLDIIACPEKKTPLRVADAGLVDKLNAAVDKGKLRDRGGRVLGQRLQGALVREDGEIAYPVFDDMPWLVVDAGIELDQLR